MSHTVKIQTQFKIEHSDSLKRAFETFGWTIKLDSKIRTYPGDPDKNKVYPMIAVNPGNGYDLAIKYNQETGEIEVLGDFYGGSLASSLGEGLNKLKQEYSCRVIEAKLEYEGYSVSRQVNVDGTVDLIAE